MDTSDFGHHISSRFNEDLDRLRNSVLAMGGLVESQLQRAVEAVVRGDSELGLAVARDDQRVDRMEIEIDQACSRIIATRQPAAGDLRLIMAIIKAITDLERIGDEAEKIATLATRLATMERPADRYRELASLAAQVQEMLRAALDALARLDAKAAVQTLAMDEQVDREYDSITRQCITFMMEDPRTIGRVMNVTWVARSLERIGDHAKNICEYVVYMVHGRDVRHLDQARVARELARPTAEGQG
ncbi:MAG: phosphate signaling complex protein PhoU [Gammaproteobacteria bacterium]|nr:phosphate signaling complex protein PhoU [Gammaproteobacteria bacterium]TVQ43566.1 MAG: phosphate transport system regulatory protein PhoU [Gammaproteobacteria bacterium]